MNSAKLEPVLAKLRVSAKIFHNGQYCGGWAIDTSGSKNMTFHVLTHGECLLEVGSFSVKLEKGDAVFFPRDAAHVLRSNGTSHIKVNSVESRSMSEPMQADSVGLVCGYFEPLTPIFSALADHFPDVIVLNHKESADSAVLINLMMSEARASKVNDSALLDRYADCLFYLLLRDHMTKNKGLFAALAHPKLVKALNLIHTTEDRTVSLDDLAEAAGMSRSSFSSLFKQTVGQSPKEYVTQWRMTRAYEWLSDDGVSTLEAAVRCGYENESSFAKAFKRVMGLGPGAVRTR